VDDDPRRFGFHNLRHSLASFLVRIKTDPKTVQALLRHSDVKLTLSVTPTVSAKIAWRRKEQC
jgi:integrase